MTAVVLPAVPRVLIAEADPWSRDLLKQVLLNVRCDAGWTCVPMAKRHCTCWRKTLTIW